MTSFAGLASRFASVGTKYEIHRPSVASMT
jgi:hypothetical protein